MPSDSCYSEPDQPKAKYDSIHSKYSKIHYYVYYYTLYYLYIIVVYIIKLLALSYMVAKLVCFRAAINTHSVMMRLRIPIGTLRLSGFPT